jgi:hypothetical protein
MEDAFPLDQAKRPTNTETQQSYLGCIQGKQKRSLKSCFQYGSTVKKQGMLKLLCELTCHTNQVHSSHPANEFMNRQGWCK